MKLDVSEEAQKHLIRDGSDFEYGARPLKRTIQKEIEDPISEMILDKKMKDKKILKVGEDQDHKLTFQTE